VNYLTRIEVDRRTAARFRLKDTYAWHQAIWKAFPTTDDRKFLFRIEPHDREFLVYLLSQTSPKMQQWGHWETKEIALSFLDHESYHFQLCANPTVKRKREGRKNGTRTAIYDVEQLKAWLTRKATDGGFVVDDAALQITPPMNQPFYKDRKRGNHKRVEFQGILNVIDKEKFKATFTLGIGSAKAFGFGLLVLQPIK